MLIGCGEQSVNTRSELGAGLGGYWLRFTRSSVRPRAVVATMPGRSAIVTLSAGCDTSARVQSGRDDPSDRSSILGTPLWMGQDDLAVGAQHHVSAQLATVLAEV